MEYGLFYRINIKFLEPNRLNQAFKSRFHRELDNNSIYLGIRFNPTNYNRSAAINSLELANRCIIMANNLLIDDYGQVKCHMRKLQYSTDFMKSIIDTDTRTLFNYIQDEGFTSKLNTAIGENRAFLQSV
ncbi:MAG: hypothetical protein OQK82_09410 [Candidatus Pacearchaeota archaeon]|nr:hypothetical protein [Candidatus Pacearchaeota archaeon]